jgi:hypothetical protein
MIIPVNAACELFDATSCTNIVSFINAFLIPTLQTIIVGLAAIFILVSAIQYIISGAEEKADTKKAQATLTNAAIGLVIALLVVVVLNVVKTIVGGGAGGFTGAAVDIIRS